MTGAAGPNVGERVYRIIHAALLVGVIVCTALVAVLAQRVEPALETFRLPLRVAGFLELGFLVVAGTLVRRTVVPPTSGAARNAWVGGQGPPVLPSISVVGP